MPFSFFLWSVVLAFIWAKLEINIEGEHGWAEKLPTWRMNNKFIKLFLAGSPLTGYHLWSILLILMGYHLPFFVGKLWNIANELEVLGIFLIFLIMEDFLWFVLNPAYGISKFDKEHISWHKVWFFGFPSGYYLAVSLGLALLFLSNKITV